MGSEDEREKAGTRRLLRIDLVLALVALAVSVAAAAASIFQTRVVAEQLSASVWPYLSQSIDNSGHASRPQTRWSIVNDGNGPAILRGARLAIDGRPVSDLRDAAAALGRAHHVAAKLVGAGSIDYGSVVRSGEQIVYLTLESPSRPNPFENSHDVSITVCYCSMLDTCWILSGDPDRRPVHDCSSFGRTGIGLTAADATSP